MSRREPNQPRGTNVSDQLGGIFDGIARFLLYVGGGAALLGIGIMIYSFFMNGGQSGQNLEQAAQYADYFRQAGLFGMLGVSLAVAWLMWGEETAGPIMLIVGFALYFMPTYMPSAAGGNLNSLQTALLENLSICGAPAILVGFFMVIGDVFGRIKTRAVQGAKADQMKYGKGVKEERDVRNVFLGKCWQLPYCRKFVRERCPIYHAKRTCWKERVGCMCEESVIKNAMEGKVIPKDMVAASKFIPQNNKLTPNQKAERCRQCIIYNEHQKHKYKLALPLTAVSIAGIYVVMRPVLADSIKQALISSDNVVSTVTGGSANNAPVEGAAKVTSIETGVIPYHEIILVVLTLVALAYAIKILEYVIFRAKG